MLTTSQKNTFQAIANNCFLLTLRLQPRVTAHFEQDSYSPRQPSSTVDPAIPACCPKLPPCLWWPGSDHDPSGSKTPHQIFVAGPPIEDFLKPNRRAPDHLESALRAGQNFTRLKMHISQPNSLEATAENRT
jgi:hypothetical protein